MSQKTRAPITLVHAANYQGSLQNQLDQTGMSFTRLKREGIEQYFFYEQHPAPLCMIITHHPPSDYCTRWLGGRNLTCTLTGYDERRITNTAKRINDLTAIRFTNSLPDKLVRFAQANMQSVFAEIAKDPKKFIRLYHVPSEPQR